MATPRLEIDLSKIHHNTRWMVEFLDSKKISTTGVTKVTLGDPKIAQTMLRAGVGNIGDSRIENIQKMREAGITATFLLLRNPLKNQISQVVKYADISFNTELSTIVKLSDAAREQKKTHKILLMIELGDLREGILPENIDEIVRQTLQLPNIKLIGIGTNLGCLGGVKPDRKHMDQLIEISKSLELKFGVKFEIVSGGNSASLEWLFNCKKVGTINNIRLGESILLGRDTMSREPIEGLYTDPITLIAEVIESNIKPSVPTGEICQNVFGIKPTFQDNGMVHHAILGIGRQDVSVSGLKVLTHDLDIFGENSDLIVVVSKDNGLKIGQEVRFSLNYEALLVAMTSPFVKKVFQ